MNSKGSTMFYSRTTSDCSATNVTSVVLNATTVMRQCVVSLALLLTVASSAHAQWTVTNLHPAGAGDSRGSAVSGGQQAGAAQIGGVFHAGLWSGTAASWVDLHPAGLLRSFVYATNGTQQAGYAYVSNQPHASLWNGTAASWVDLHPASSIQSYAYANVGGQQAGVARTTSGDDRASLWSGTAASWVNLHPAGAFESAAYAIGGGQQAGWAIVGGVQHASLWTGTAASWVDLHPAGSNLSWVYGISGAQQVGYARFGGVLRAGLWTGTAASWVDLHPAGATFSQAYAVSGGWQAGYAVVAGVQHAGVWNGTAASWVDLNSYQPGGFTSTQANGVASDGTHLYVTGIGYNAIANRSEALLWTRPLCTAASIATQPQAATICPSGTATFSVVASGSGPFTYQWRKNTVAINTATNASAAMQTLTLTGIGPADAGNYDCTVGNTCGSATSNPAALTVITCGGCSLADIAGGGELGNQPDGTIDGTDFIAFVNSFGIGDAGVDPAADVAGGGDDGLQPDGTIDGSDFIAFINAFAVGC